MSSPDDDKRTMTRARPLAECSIATQASETRTNLLDSDRSTSREQQRQTYNDMRYDDTGVALTSGPSLPNKEPWRIKPLLERCRPFGVVDTVVAKAYLDSTSLKVPDETRDDPRRKTSASNHSAKNSDDGRTRHRGTSRFPSSPGGSQSTFKPTKHAGSGRSAAAPDLTRASQKTGKTSDAVDPTEVMANVIKDLFTGKMSKKDQSKIQEQIFRSLFGGDA